MKILGINGSGWLEVAHDAAAVLVDNGKIKWGIEEERLIRQKRAYEKKPFNAAKFCLHNENLILNDLDGIAFSWNWSKYGNNESKKYEKQDYLLNLFFPKKFFNYTKKPKVFLIDHHLCHASSAFRCSGFDESAILILDGQGEHCSTSIWYGNKDKEIKLIWSGKIEESLGFFYSAVCRYIGMRNGDEGKLMGLAPYGIPDERIIKSLRKFRGKLSRKDYVNRNGQMKPIINQWLVFFKNNFGPEDKTKTGFNNINGQIKKELKFTKFQKNFAASAQKFLEEEIVKYSQKALDLTKSSNLCLSGGVAMNCIANSKILKKISLNNFYVQPVSNDAGTAIGAALEASYMKGVRNFEKMDNVYLGPSFDNNQIKKVLDEAKIKYKYIKEIEKIGARLLSKGKIIAWFQGRMEMGPRALGNRSILADPSKMNMNKKVNLIKNREKWRPFAPSILKEKVSEYFAPKDNYLFMIVGSDVINKKIPAVTHKDNTSRPHSVDKKINPRYYKLIQEFEKLSKTPVVLNTSLNDKGEPLVCSPKDALRTFFSTRLEYMIMGNYLIKK